MATTPSGAELPAATTGTEPMEENAKGEPLDANTKPLKAEAGKLEHDDVDQKGVVGEARDVPTVTGIDVAQTSPSPGPPAPVVNGIDEQGGVCLDTSGARPDSKANRADAMADKLAHTFASFSTKVSEAVKASKIEVTRAVTTVVPSMTKVVVPVALCFGDSITERGTECDNNHAAWVALVQAAYGGATDVIARGFSGYNSRWALRIFPRLISGLDTSAIRVSFIFFGANDAVEAGEKQHVPLEEFKFNLTKMAHYVRTLRRLNPIMPVFITPPAVHAGQMAEDARALGLPKAIRTPERTRCYAKACVTLGKAIRVPVVDIHSAMLARAEENSADEMQDALAEFFTDGVHLSPKGDELLAAEVLKTLSEDLPQFAPENVARPFPSWRDVDPSKLYECLGTSPLVDN